jgi:hypothetical protein
MMQKNTNKFHYIQNGHHIHIKLFILQYKYNFLLLKYYYTKWHSSYNYITTIYDLIICVLYIHIYQISNYYISLIYLFISISYYYYYYSCISLTIVIIYSIHLLFSQIVIHITIIIVNFSHLLSCLISLSHLFTYSLIYVLFHLEYLSILHFVLLYLSQHSFDSSTLYHIIMMLSLIFLPLISQILVQHHPIQSNKKLSFQVCTKDMVHHCIHNKA